MAANEGWYSDWYATGWFPSVWFAPGDAEHLTPGELNRPGPGSFYPVSRSQHGRRRRLYDINGERDRARRRREDEFLLLGCS